MLKKTLSLTVATIIVIVLLIPAGRASAELSDTVTITVLINKVVSVAITSGAAWDLTGVNLDADLINTAAIVVENDGANTSIDLSLNGDPTATNWALDETGTPGADRFTLHGIFNSVQPAVADFGSDHLITFLATPASATRFAGDSQGRQIPVGGGRNLWLKLHTPLFDTYGTAQTIVVTVTAEASG